LGPKKSRFPGPTPSNAPNSGFARLKTIKYPTLSFSAKFFPVFQACIATHESNGLGIITALILNDINPLGKTRMDLVLELKNNASKLLLAIMESRFHLTFFF
jgi:hypothetical protein